MIDEVAKLHADWREAYEKVFGVFSPLEENFVASVEERIKGFLIDQVVREVRGEFGLAFNIALGRACDYIALTAGRVVSLAENQPGA